MHLIQIPAEKIQDIWPLAAVMLRPVLAYANGATGLAAELEYLTERKKQLWMVVQNESQGRAKGVAAGITSLQKNADGSLTANVEYFGGENMKAWFSLKGEFEQWARDEGCCDVRLWARKGWAKHLPDYTITHYVMRKALT